MALRSLGLFRTALLGSPVALAACPSDGTNVVDTDDGSSSGSTGDATTSTGDPDTSTGETTTAPTTTIDPDSSSSEGDTSSGSSESGFVGCGDGDVDIGAGEACDGTNLDGRDCISEDFAGGVLACNDDCTLDTSGCTFECGDDVVQGDEQCEGNDFEGATCISEGFDGGDLACNADCTLDTSGCENYVCGDGVIAGPEVCDGANLDGETCVSQGFDSGNLACLDDCSGLDTSDCHVCGDGVIDPAEQCDGAALDGQTCVTLGLDGGVLSCAADCTFELAECTGCGNGDQDPGEACDTNDFGGVRCDDLGFDGGTPTCTAACTIDPISCFGTHTFCVQPNLSLATDPTSAIPVAGLAGVLADVDVVVDATHTDVGALTVEVRHVDTDLTVNLAENQCMGGDDIDATFDQDALTGPACGGPPAFSGSVLPQGDLDTYVGGAAGSGNGTWELAIDNASMLDGNLAQWCVNLTTEADGETLLYVVNDTTPNSVTGYSIAADGSLSELVGSPYDTGGSSSFNHHPDAIVSCGPYVYTANYASGNISAFTVEADGSLTTVPGSPFPSFNAVGLACNDTHLFASDFSQLVHQFEIAGDGSLVDIGSTNAGSSTLGMTLDRATNRLVVAGWSSQVNVFDVGGDGSLTPVPGSPFQTGGSNHSASISPGGAFVATEGNAGVNMWNVSDDGSLSSVLGSPFADPTGCEVVGLAWAPDASRLFVGHRGCFPGAVMVYDVAVDGTLSPVAGAPFLTGGNEAVGLAVGAEGTRLYVSHINDQLTSVLDVASDGTLTPVAGSPFANGVAGNHSWLVIR